MNSTTKKIVMASMLAALCCVATMIIKIPSPLEGYLNLGDCVVLLSGFMLSPLYGFLAAGIGSSLADIFSGYVLYAPITFIVKGIMALVAYFGFAFLKKRTGHTAARIMSGICAEIIMLICYYVFEGFMYGFVAAAVNIPANAIQGLFGLVFGMILVRIFEKHKITF